MHWKDEALCQGDTNDLAFDADFFENYEQSIEVRERIDELCSDCPVKRTCLKEAISTQSTGVHGGIYLELGYYDRTFNKHKPLHQRKAEEELVKDIRRGLRQKNV